MIDPVRQIGRRPGHGKIAQGIRQPASIAIEPVQLTAVESIEDAVLPIDHEMLAHDMNDAVFGRDIDGFGVLDRDITKVAPPEILKTSVLRTVVGGKTVYEAK